MTVIAGAVQGRVVAIAADSRICWGEVYADGHCKLHQLGAAVLGTSGGAVYDRYLRQAPPLIVPAGDGLDRSLVESWLDTLVDGLLQWARDRGHGTSEGREHAISLYALVATPLGLWEINSDGSTVYLPGGYGAQGSGAQLALGALHVLQDAAPADRVRRACEAAVAHSRGCGGEIQVVTLDLQRGAGE
jgi:ATP-dependent protease HslVU (ClpYQ) peptidase subunit